MKIRMHKRLSLCAMSVLTAAALVGSIRKGDCQVAGTIAFARYTGSTSSGSSQIYKLKGTGLQQLTPLQENFYDSYPSWSPEGSRIAFVSSRSTSSTYTLSTILADGSQRTTLLTSSYYAISRPAWSPDSRWIAFGMGGSLYLLDMYFKRGVIPPPVLLYNPGSAGAASTPTWRPDSGRLAFTFFDYNTGYTDIYGINVNGSGLNNLTNTPAIGEGNPAWSPRGKSIAYVQGRAFSVNTDLQGDIYRMDEDGSNRRQVTYTWGVCYGTPAWSPDEEMIAYSAQSSNGYYKLFATVPDYGGTMQLTFGYGHDYYPSWKR